MGELLWVVTGLLGVLERCGGGRQVVARFEERRCNCSCILMATGVWSISDDGGATSTTARRRS
ncbi:conserved hypothetical protein [Ricinus communis]|uniref:Secreted protein n=1 Tax=Ricinus communis TaxID=3988 RepID=B9S282_RICCO|nr:conserved hypothetical protein [Ricinus communis]